MKLPLELRQADRRAPTAAWFLPGDAPREWLDELLAMGLPWQHLHLLPVPASSSSGRCLGVIACAPDGTRPRHLRRALPYRRRASGTWTPLEADIWPPVSDDELDVLAAGRTLVLHPTIGAVAFDPQDALTVADLLAAPTHPPRAYSRARPGDVLTGAIVEVVSRDEVSFDELFAEDREDIGSQAPEELPPLPDEMPLRTRVWFTKGLRGFLARIVLELTQRAPGGASSPTWIDRLAEWARRHRHEKLLPTAQQQQREREIARLLRLLKDDPAEGLRYALPMGGGDGRGKGFDGNRLSRHETEFSLRRLDRGGRRVDRWDMSARQRFELLQRYLELARAETAARRFRRAAYIYAHLLGDLAAAANTLEQGGFAREAAKLYLERLHDSRSASRCLVRAGLLADAARIEEAQKAWERAGDLRLMLGQQARARAYYEKAAVQADHRGYWREAAMLRAEKLRDPEGALRLLEERLHRDREVLVFAAWLALALRTGRVVEVAHAVREWLPDLPPAQLGALLDRFAHHVGPGPLRDAANDRLRRAIAHHAARGDLPGDRLLAALRACAPGDRVLPYDLADVRKRQVDEAAAVGDRASKRGRIERISQRITHRAATWHGAAATHHALWLSGVTPDDFDRHSVLLCMAWVQGDCRPLPVAHAVPTSHRVVAARTHAAVWHVVEHASGATTLRLVDLLGDDSGEIRLPGSVYDLDVDSDGSVWLLQYDHDELTLHSYAGNGKLRGIEIVPLKLPLDGTVGIVVNGGVVAVRTEIELLVRQHEDGWTHAFPPQGEPLRQLVRSEEPANPYVIAVLSRGLAVFSLRDKNPSLHRRYAEDLDTPTVGWTRRGAVVAIDGRHAWVSRVSGNRMHDAPPSPYPHGEPWRILPTPHPDRLVLLYSQTVVEIDVTA